VSTRDIDQAIFHIASALQVPVLILALLALALVIYELGGFLIELRVRRGRRFSALSESAEAARRALAGGDRAAAAAAVGSVARSAPMADTLAFIVAHARTAGSEHQLNKALADFDFDAQRRLGRTRMLVRFGPALGLMGSPAWPVAIPRPSATTCASPSA
jgi:biopolymer transport protein ExbB/TolQ